MLIVGLGNPGKKYENTIHNMGFMTIDVLLDKMGAILDKKGCDALYCVQYIGGKKHIIAKPQTYMNLSGISVKQLANSNKIDYSQVLIIYDDIDLPLGNVRVRKDGSGGSHNGMKNIVAECATTAIARVRIGVGDERNGRDLKDYVLSKVGKEKRAILDRVFDAVADGIWQYMIDSDIDALMRKLNGKLV
ncbi:MAG: aminoacyl-tRNA hydrolase [Clostridia bacterium]|nr:aminoacyl-tRNA hydrolase [Clostridia bacterium]MDE7215298.1 aminoacyl-tRNA hydrolase [Clostridia bacterium]